MTEEDQVEKVTFWKHNNTSQKTAEASISNHLMMISLPRLKCLEVDGEPYRPSWAVYKAEPTDYYTTKRLYEPHKKKKSEGCPITQKEERIYKLYQQGLNTDTIVEMTGMLKSAVVGARNRAVKKYEHQKEIESETNDDIIDK